jgi:hypothetical protein
MKRWNLYDVGFGNFGFVNNVYNHFKSEISHPTSEICVFIPFSTYPLSRFPQGERLRPLLPPGGRLGRGLRDKGKVGKGVEG